MYAVERISSYISRGVYTVSGPFHPFGGAVDIIVVQQPDGSFKTSPWYVKFGKFQGVLKTKEKVVSIAVNGVEADFHMYLDHKGEAYFLRELEGEQGEQGESVFSPSSSGDETEEQSQNGRIKKSKSGDFDANQPSSPASTDESNSKILAKTSSRRSGILGLVFGRKSMKEDGSRSKGSSVGAERMGSLERAEIAADLLDMKWCTDLPTIEPKMDNTSKDAVPVDEVDGDLQPNNKQSPGSSLLGDSINISSDLPTVNVETDPCNNSGSGPNNPESPDEVISPKEPPLTTPEQFMEISTFEAFDRSEIISEVSTVIDEFSLRIAVFDEMAEGSVSESTMAGLQNPDLVELDAGQSTHSGIEQFSDKMSSIISSDISVEKTENRNFNSFAYCEATEISTVGMNGSFAQATETMEFCYGRCEEVEPHARVLYQNTELITEVTPRPDSKVVAVEENLCASRIIGDGDSSEFLNTKTVHENELTSLNSTAESLSPPNLHSTFNSVEVNHQHTMTEGLSQNDNLEMGPVEILENESQTTDLSHSHISEYNGVDLGKPSKVLVLLNQEAGVNEIFESIEEAVPQGMHISSDRSSSSPVQWKENIGLDDYTKDHCPSSEFVCDTQEAVVDSLFLKESIPPSEGSEEDQLLFGDIDGLDPVGVQFKESVFQESLQTENHPSLTLDGIEDDHERVDLNHASSLSPGKLSDEYTAINFEGLIEESGTKSSPVSIPRAHMASGENGVWLPESLPIIRNIDSLEGSNACHPLSHSLDSNSLNLKLSRLGQVVSTLSKPDADSEHNLAHEHPRVLGTQASEELVLKSTSSPVEISLCKHLLYEEMGVDAALQAFDAEKVDLENYISLGPALIKHDRFIVKIRGHYFTWDAAAPIILGMAAFGCEQIFKPEGMIVIDRVEKMLVGDPERAIVRSGGSWRLWPFPIGKSRTVNSIQPALNDTKDSGGSDYTGDMIKDKNVPKIKVTKKKVRSIIPTSEQLATLNLEEGRNIITFTFSTAMLGRQQVDARIYLWKWNTRIVVSDVDGTITKSDVLGQFMPLVGKDWSQTGVTHLFSAIKENGYQLLFLSARAISQAHLTRQFLFNLRQDGKALPDGPVVISPDGLFPSIFREVIRRAPHEFKIACLEDIKALFPPDCNPFYAGFGNRDTDEFSYLKVGIPKGKIFIINPKGEVAINRWVDTKSYTSLHALVNGMFPARSSAEQEDFNSWNFWKVPLPEINF